MAQEDLPAFGGALAVDRGGHARADDEQLSVAGVDEVEVEGAAVDALGDPEFDPLHEVGGPSPLDERAHVEAGGCGPGGVFGALEQHEQRVAAELEHVAAVAVDDLDHPAEALVQQLGEFLGAFTAERGEAFGERREAGDVGGDERPFDLSVLADRRSAIGERDREDRTRSRSPTVCSLASSTASPEGERGRVRGQSVQCGIPMFRLGAGCVVNDSVCRRHLAARRCRTCTRRTGRSRCT